jgi:hypothetical protein
VSGQWTWAGGSDQVADQASYGVYGPKGVPDSANIPGARTQAVSWTGANGDLWLFGGQGYSTDVPSSLNDLWKWSASKEQWAWISGSNLASQNGSYGNLDIPAPGNVPGARYGAISWTDPAGNLWLFGGHGVGSVPSTWGPLNDLWKWEVSSGLWTWVGGSNLVGQKGTYGTRGIAAPGNAPGARSGAVSWSDGDGNLWLFGGTGYAASGGPGADLNDLWKWDPSAAQWTWVSGSSIADQFGSYGTLGATDPANVPGARHDASAWTDAGGNLWLFGGLGNSASEQGWLNDLWKWDITGGQWTWVDGSNASSQPGN